MNATEDGRSGIFGFFGKLLEGGLALVEEQVERVAVDLREEKKRLINTAILAGIVVAFALMTIVMASFLIVVVFWENARIPAVAALALFYLAVTIFAWRNLRLQLKKLPFSRTLHDLGRGRERLAGGKNGAPGE